MNNLSATSSPPASRTSERDAPSAPRGETLRHHPARDKFERALQSRQQREEPSEEDEPGGTEPAPPAPTWLNTMPAQLPLRAASAAPAHAAAGVIAEPSGTKAAVEASLTASPGQAVTPLAGTEPAALWEVSLGGSAVPMALRAERTGGTEAQRAWGLTISSPAANVEMLVRHAPRLNERLRKHEIGLDHVRVEQADDEPQR